MVVVVAPELRVTTIIMTGELQWFSPFEGRNALQIILLERWDDGGEGLRKERYGKAQDGNK